MGEDTNVQPSTQNYMQNFKPSCRALNFLLKKILVSGV